MTTFIGDYPCKVDVKGRILLPAAFKKQMRPPVNERFIVRKDLFEKCLVLYPVDEWERQVKIIRNRLNLYKREHSQFLREFYSGTAEVILDGNNRVLIPKRLLEWVDIKNEAVLAGQDGRIQLWNKELYDKLRIDEEDFAQLAEKVMGDLLKKDEE